MKFKKTGKLKVTNRVERAERLCHCVWTAIHLNPDKQTHVIRYLFPPPFFSFFFNDFAIWRAYTNYDKIWSPDRWRYFAHTMKRFRNCLGVEMNGEGGLRALYAYSMECHWHKICLYREHNINAIRYEYHFSTVIIAFMWHFKPLLYMLWFRVITVHRDVILFVLFVLIVLIALHYTRNCILLQLVTFCVCVFAFCRFCLIDVREMRFNFGLSK